jgi:hypothetical protein
MVQIYVVTAPTEVLAGVVVQVVIPALPVIFQVIVPVGAAAPAVPVTVVVKVRVELSVPPPVPVSTTVGVTWAITTEVGAVVASAM